MRPASVLLTAAVIVVSGTALAAGSDVFQGQPANGRPASPTVPEALVNYVVDDGTNENNIGLNNTSAGTSTQFFWFNRFDIVPADLPIRVDQVQVFWDPTPTGAAVVGNAVSVEIYSDSDADPSNGATHAYTENATIAQVGVSFDTYTLTTPPEIAAGQNLLIGVVNRWISSGVSTSSYPAALDTTASAGRSWVAASASGTPPTPPAIPSDSLFGTIDSFGLPGNWLIRAVAESNVPVELRSFDVD